MAEFWYLALIIWITGGTVEHFCTIENCPSASDLKNAPGWQRVHILETGVTCDADNIYETAAGIAESNKYYKHSRLIYWGQNDECIERDENGSPMSLTVAGVRFSYIGWTGDGVLEHELCHQDTLAGHGTDEFNECFNARMSYGVY